MNEFKISQTIESKQTINMPNNFDLLTQDEQFSFFCQALASYDATWNKSFAQAIVEKATKYGFSPREIIGDSC